MHVLCQKDLTFEPANVFICIKLTIRINKPIPLGIIVPAPQIVQPGLLVVHIPAVAERIQLSKCVLHGTLAHQRFAPWIVPELYHLVCVVVDVAITSSCGFWFSL